MTAAIVRSETEKSSGMMTMTKMAGIGCVADECRGFVGQCRSLAELLSDYGCDDADLIAHLLRGYSHDLLPECADDAVMWLNENAVADEHYIGFCDGDLMLADSAWWETEGY